MVRKILRHAEILRFGLESSQEDQASLFGDRALRAEESRDARGRFRRRSRELRYLVSEAYLSLFRVVPEDHVLADPICNQEFIERCRALGASEPEAVLNRVLLNARKAGEHAGVRRASVAQLDSETVDTVVAPAELSARMVQLMVWDEIGREPSIDEILCTPGYRDAFDHHSSALLPRTPARVFRLVLLGLRKSTRFVGTGRAADHLGVPAASVRLDRLRGSELPPGGGVYRLRIGRKREFISWTLNFQKRLIRHAHVADGCLLPKDWNVPLDAPVTADVFPIGSDKRTVLEPAADLAKGLRPPLWNLPLTA